MVSPGGYFLKTNVGEQLLSAVRRDGNNQIFPITWGCGRRGK